MAASSWRWLWPLVGAQLLGVAFAQPAHARVSCAAVSTNSLTLRLEAGLAVAATEFQICALGEWHRDDDARDCAAERAHRFDGAAQTLFTLDDLLPATRYALRVRRLDAHSGEWRPAAAEPIVCATAAPRPRQPIGVARAAGSALEPTCVELAWPPLPDALGYELRYDDEPATALAARAVRSGDARSAAASARLCGLAPDSAVRVRVRARFGGAPRIALGRAPPRASTAAWGPWSDAVTLRTASAAFEPMAVLRFAERCLAPLLPPPPPPPPPAASPPQQRATALPPRAVVAAAGASPVRCEPDYLTSHDGADALADAAFLTRYVSDMLRCGHDPLGLNWPRTVVARYCVQLRRGDGAAGRAPTRASFSPSPRRAGAGGRAGGRASLAPQSESDSHHSGSASGAPWAAGSEVASGSEPAPGSVSEVAPPVSEEAPPVSEVAPPVSEEAPPVSEVAPPVSEVPWGEYLSCNGRTAGAYACLCHGRYDRTLARRPTDGCEPPPAPPAPPAPPPPPPAAARCAHRNASDLNIGRCACDLPVESARVGRMPTFLPFPSGGAPDGRPFAPPRNASEFGGNWFSFPRNAECARPAALLERDPDLLF
jgi:hypothetical protein